MHRNTLACRSARLKGKRYLKKKITCMCMGKGMRVKK